MHSRLILMKQTCAFLRSSRQAQRGSFDLSPVCLHFNLRSLHFMLAPATRIEATLKSYTHGTYKLYGFCRSVLTCFFLGVITYMQPQSSPLTKMKTRLSEPTVLRAFSESHWNLSANQIARIEKTRSQSECGSACSASRARKEKSKQTQEEKIF